MTTFNDPVFQMGGVPVGSPLGILGLGKGKMYFLDPTNGSDTNLGTSPDAAVKTWAVAWAKLTANQHDTLVLMSGTSGLNLPAAVDWNKSYTHLIGLCAPTHAGQRARIFQLSTLTGASPLFTVSAQGCCFENFYIMQGVADATSLINVSVTGGRNYFQNVHFAGGGHATQAIDGGASLKLDGAEENLFENCTIGLDTIDAAAGMMGIVFDSEAHRNTFRNCTIRMKAGAATAGFVEIADLTGIDRDNLFDKCNFLNNSATAMNSGFVIPAGMGAPRKILLKDCMILGTTKLDEHDRGVLFGNMNAVTGADLSGVAVQLIS